ncbi:LysR family transcriptional regulator [Pelagibacterium xiamenense]|uniref:LysR family transcriptional regulator n=1 Tax=Pelagibacterium xiamenense TaxID=2901140 RepID=UPI001E373AA7|nr:LysR family transcriptional regulator [Pelagibacterium xiamenense]MCD7060267.1 LysR family transcriptional regulator [Pelagibacterium xiamenense]
MDWRAIKFDWNRARAFLVTAEEGSLSAAARALGMAQPTLGRQVDALEDELGVVLFERAGRGLILTPAGLGLLDHVRAMGDAANRVSLAASGNAQSIEGTICITASEIYSAYLLPPIVERLRREAPGIAIEIVATNAAIDLRRREADIAVRSFRPTQPDLIAKMIGDDFGRLYATPAYLERIGNPRTVDDLSRADFISFDIGDTMIEALNRLGLKLTKDNFPLVTGSHYVHWELVKQGVAIGVMPDWIADPEPSVRQVLPDFDPIPIPVWLTAHRELNTSRRVRLVFDIMAEELGKRF